MNKYNCNEKYIERQAALFGERYAGASLSKIDLSDIVETRLNAYLKDPKGMLLFQGAPGVGKTYFCAALIEWAIPQFKSFRYFSEKELLKRLRMSISEGRGDYVDVLESLIDDPLVILDDIGSGINPEKLSYKDFEWRREVLFAFLDYRYNRELPTVMTSNFTKTDFENVYSERICSRLFASENTIISMFGDNLDKRQLGM